ncbi:MAG: phosphoribosylformylglycinamidine synthase subunit PurS [Proteobacteria bacterium]|nr:phosphoribosylformylglycinamidine synthase subunit PurS [Pseudomonadota bacterium]NDC25003.1 phosphoribosylformylglycinamidine synthase subunit PurS [Pseudomonadota bacterium]NDD05490.1 phosphoribosylformylglycinamidine synthase subunit PurS [Pseudomonadota bacterium]NDG27541.1 phosphoribosylformylglycinamidine synthase subunit PurS [Pseudomonadota bacterium]
MKARVHIFFKESVLDPQGSTVASSLQRLGFSKVKEVRMGKVIDLILDHQLPEEARKDVAKMCEKLLVNPVIESYRVELLEK